jgi:hypothetical protein
MHYGDLTGVLIRQGEHIVALQHINEILDKLKGAKLL